ncbi:MAG: aminotransferase class V-fold PLP-dependent enzyme [Gammaproteobacteria bacterium]|nr:aminotransferase class V-fold PLP-dependent enzyme [Gammaproteobacteria bacterium]
MNGFPLAYLDSAATTQRPAAVLTALQDYYRHDNANPGKALHALARRAFDRYEGVTEAVRASCYLYTETSELDRLADALDQLLASQA